VLPNQFALILLLYIYVLANTIQYHRSLSLYCGGPLVVSLDALNFPEYAIVYGDVCCKCESRHFML
jgi:hypothetical protein